MEQKKGIFAQVGARKASFALSFAAILFLTYVFLAVMGAVPVAPAEGEVSGVSDSASEQVSPVEEPVRIVAASISLDEKVQNPQSSDVKVLDTALLAGAVRYPGSAFLGEDGNVLLFGHSSYLSTVWNGAYKTFNDIQKLRTGDMVTVYSRNMAYTYRVSSVKFVKAEEGVVDLSRGRARLTLVTCNSFGAKSDRFVVEAEYVGSSSLR